MHITLTKATLIFCDNVSSVYMLSNPMQHQRTKHVELDLHFFHEKVALGEAKVLHVPVAYQYANIFSKGLSSSLFVAFRDSLTVHKSDATTAGG